MIVLKATQDKVLAVLQSVAGIVERRHTLPILANVLIKKTGNALQLTTSDLEIQIRTTAELGGDTGDFTTTIGARKLIDILKTMPGDQTVSLETQQAKMILKGGKSRFTLQTLPAEDFPWCRSRPPSAPFSVPQKVLKDLLGQVSFSMAVQDIRYYLNGILFVAEGKQLSLVATDGHRLAWASATLDVEVPIKQEVILPRKTVLELQRLLSDVSGENQPVIEMQFANNQAKFTFGGMEFVTKLVEGKFPDYNRVIPKNHTNSVTLGRAPLLLRCSARHHDQRQVQGRAPVGRARHLARGVQQRRAGRGHGRTRYRLRWRHHRDRLQRDLSDRRALQHEPGHGQDRPAGRQQLGADHHSRDRQLQVRRDAHAHLRPPSSKPALLLPEKHEQLPLVIHAFQASIQLKVMPVRRQPLLTW